MDRLACVDLPAFPLQLLLRGRPEWSEPPVPPVAVVDKDGPQGRILWVNETAYRTRILPGQRYAAALSLSGDLRAEVVGARTLAEGVEAVVALLREFTPSVEPDEDEPGTFWLDASGLARIFRSASRWAGAIEASLDEAGFRGGIAVGFSRFGTYAVARAERRVVLFRSPEEETATARRVPLDRLGLDPPLRDALDKLGVRTLGRFLDLPHDGVRGRFGEEAWRLHRMAAGRMWQPLEPLVPDEPLARSAELEAPDGDSQRLLFRIKRLLDPLLDLLDERGSGVRELRVGFVLDRREARGSRGAARWDETIRPAEPTADGAQLMDLIRLRLEAIDLDAGVVELELEVEEDLVPADQMRLWNENTKRDPKAAARALARLVAELGEGAVAHARLHEGHMPEAGYLWEPLAPGTAGGATRPRAAAGARRSEATAESGAASPPAPPPGVPLVRRILPKPRPLPPRSHHLRDDGWLIHGSDHGAVSRLVGPFVVSGGWWRQSVHREYHFAETQRGDILWVYFDRRRRRWFLHGQVE